VWGEGKEVGDERKWEWIGEGEEDFDGGRLVADEL